MEQIYRKNVAPFFVLLVSSSVPLCQPRQQLFAHSSRVVRLSQPQICKTRLAERAESGTVNHRAVRPSQSRNSKTQSTTEL